MTDRVRRREQIRESERVREMRQTATKRAFEHLSRVRASVRDIEHVGKPVTKRNK